MKADEVRLYALRGGFLKQAVCYTHFHSNKVFRGDLQKNISHLQGALCTPLSESRGEIYSLKGDGVISLR